MHTLTGHANIWFRRGLRDLLQDGITVTARGRTTKEFLQVLTTLPHPRKRVLTVPRRRANPFFQAAETVWILAGRSDEKWLRHYNTQMAKFLDQGSNHFHAAYGERLRNPGGLRQLDRGAPYRHDQIQEIILQLKQDPGSRRAVATLHDPEFDNASVLTNDRPCNIAVSYQLRDGLLYASTFNRSNDYVLGLTFTNIVQFTVLQEFIAAALQANPGPYVHFSSSLHVYTDDPIVPLVTENGWGDFDIYQYRTFQPAPMMPWPTEDYGFRLVESLVQIPEQPWDNIDVASIKCPYWQSVALLLIAWQTLKAGDAGSARDKEKGLAITFDVLENMKAGDWRVAALEYVHRWATNRHLRPLFLELLHRCAFPMGVENYITHDVTLPPA